MELAYEIMDTDPNSLYQSILFLELYSMEAFRIEELLRYTDEGDLNYYDFLKDKARLLQRIEEEKELTKQLKLEEKRRIIIKTDPVNMDQLRIKKEVEPN